jgi:predicted DNA-binding transcriptional regulator AlpA
MLDDPERLLKAADAAALVGISLRHFKHLRATGNGPPVVRVPGSAVVRYRRRDLLAWLAGSPPPGSLAGEAAR